MSSSSKAVEKTPYDDIIAALVVISIMSKSLIKKVIEFSLKEKEVNQDEQN